MSLPRQNSGLLTPPSPSYAGSNRHVVEPKSRDMGRGAKIVYADPMENARHIHKLQPCL